MTQVPAQYRPLEGSERRVAAGAHRTGAANPREIITVSVYLRPRPDAPPLPTLKDWMTPQPGRRRFMTLDEGEQRYSADPADLKKVETFAREHQLTVLEVSASLRRIVLSGTVARMEEAFAVDLGRYESTEQTYRGREGAVHLPSDLIGIVAGVFGLDDRRIATHSAAVTPLQVAGLYDFPSGNGAGQTIGILEFGGGFATTDINQFLSGLGLTTPTITTVSVDGATNTQAGSATNVWTNNTSKAFRSDPDIEVTLDIDVVASVAQGANIVVYFAPNTERGWIDAVTTAVGDTTNRPSVLSASWGGDESNWTGLGLLGLNQAWMKAALMGITVFVSTGDLGSDDGVQDGKAHVQYPASDPWVTACGGTSIANISPLNEVTWSTGAVATGGGISTLWDLPLYQAQTNVPPSINDGTSKGRGLPDISGNAGSGYNLTLYGTQTTALVETSGANNGKTLGTIGGTSAVAPLYAGLLAIVNAGLSQRVGLFTPYLYLFGNSPWLNLYRDIADGASNAINFTTAAGVAGTSAGYTSTGGWDACTGWGVADGTALKQALVQGLVINNVDSTPSAPAICEGKINADSSLRLYWKANDSSSAIYSSFSKDGIVFSSGKQINGADSTSDSPAACFFREQFFLFWKANDSSHAIYFSPSRDGNTFPPGQKINPVDATSDSPSACVFENRILLYWKANDRSNAIYVSPSPIGSSVWPAGQTINTTDSTSAAPASCVFKNKVFLFWKANDESNAIFVSESGNGILFPAGRRINESDSSTTSPAACVVDNQMFLFWRSNDDNAMIYWSASEDGLRWPPGQPINYVDSTPDTPVAIAFRKNLLLYWEANDDSAHIFQVSWPFSLFKEV